MHPRTHCAGPEAFVPPLTSPISETVRAMDRAACKLHGAAARSSLQLAQLARNFVDRKAWKPFGYMQLEDYTRERLGRSARWLRDLAALQAGVEALPGLTAAILGRDGAKPVGRVAALRMARIACPESLDTWLALARSQTVRELERAASKADKAGSKWPLDDEAPDAGSSSNSDADAVEPCIGCIPVPAAMRVAFEDVLDLHRAVCGHEASVASFVDALAAEAELEPIANPAMVEPLRLAKRRREREAHLARVHRNWQMLGEPCEPDEALDLHPFDGDLTALDRELRAQIDREDEIERELGRLLSQMNSKRVWRELGFADLGHYGEERLGLARRTVEIRAALAQAVHSFPLLRAAYESGRLGQESAILVLRALASTSRSEASVQAWIEHACAVTVKRLRDDLRLLARKAAEGEAPCLPPSDAEWHASLFREPGMTRERLARLAQLAIDTPGLGARLTFRLPEDVALRFFGSIESARRAASRGFAGLAAQTFSKREEAVPAWVGLLNLLENYAAIWDRAELVPKRRWDATYRRDAYRCMAPACTSRSGLQNHHVHYRSRRGSDRLENQINLCWGHHQEGEHGNLARVRGVAPLGLTWRLGRMDLASWYRNERRLDRWRS